MQINFTEEQIMLRDMVREFTEKEIAPRDKWMDENGFDKELFAKMKAAGFFTIPLPKKYGGAGCDFITNTMVIHEVAKGSASIALFLDSAWLGADMILVNGNEEQKEKYLSAAASGKLICFALTEPSGGSDAAALRSTAVKNADGNWVLCGSKSWITNIDADYYVIMAKTDPEAGARGISTFIVPREADGFSVGNHEDKMGLRGSETGELFYDNVVLPPDALLGELGMGFKYAMAALDGARVSIAAVSTGLTDHAMQIAKNYAKERVTFGKPIAKHQGIQFKFADISSMLRAMELMVYDAAAMKAEGKRLTLQAAQTKLLCSTWATQLCLECMQVLGGNGCSKEFHVERLVRDAKMIEIAEGTSEIQRMLIGGAILASK